MEMGGGDGPCSAQKHGCSAGLEATQKAFASSTQNRCVRQAPGASDVQMAEALAHVACKISDPVLGIRQAPSSENTEPLQSCEAEAGNTSNRRRGHM